MPCRPRRLPLLHLSQQAIVSALFVMLFTGLAFALVAAASTWPGCAVVLVTGRATRPTQRLDVMPDRAVLARESGDGGAENVYRLLLMNASTRSREIRLSGAGGPATFRLEGVSHIRLEPGQPGHQTSRRAIFSRNAWSMRTSRGPDCRVKAWPASSVPGRATRR